MADRILIGTRKGVFTVDRGRSGWRVNDCWFFGDHAPIVACDHRDGALYATLDHGHFGTKLHRSDDDGATWTEIGVPAYPTPKDGEEVVNPMSGKVIRWKLKMIWELRPGGDDQPGRLWCGTLPGGLFRSDDRGATWVMERDLWYREERKSWFGGGFDEAGIHSVLVDPRDSTKLIAGISCGGVWRSDDDGAHWRISARGMRAAYMPPGQQFEENVQDPHIVRRASHDPDKLWVQHHNGIFRSTDNGATWSEVDAPEPSAFGFACAVHPKDGETAWFVPAQKDEKRVPVNGRVVVNRTRDGGKTFETLRNGLPQEHAYDLTFRHALDVDATGNRLAFGSTTGSLWVTEDQGDTWRSVTSHLPPVYCVQFI